MKELFSSEILQQIKERCDLPEIVGGYISLNRHLKAICPFHEEKTPSFSIHKQKRIWHCFSCHQGGDVISFIQRIENIPFYQAVNRLAAIAGVPLPRSRETPEVLKQQFKRIKEGLGKIAYFRDVLKEYEIMRYTELRDEWRGLLLKPDKDCWDYLRLDVIEFCLFDELNGFIKSIEKIIDGIEREVRFGKYL